MLKKLTFSQKEVVENGSDDETVVNDVESLNNACSTEQKRTLSIETDESDEDLDEEEIIRDRNLPEIYIKRVLKSGTTKTGKKKKTTRVFNSYHYCGICDIKVSNFAQHLERNHVKHAACTEISKIREEKDQEKKSQLRVLLRGKFNNQYNLKVLKKKKGEILLERRPTKSFDVRDYGPCPNCLLWIAKKLMFKHQKRCVGKNSCTSSETTAMLLTQSDVISKRIPAEASKTLVKETFEILNNDDIGKVVREDSLIIQLGNVWMQKNIDNKLKRGTYTAQIIRLVGRMLLNLRKVKPLDDGDGLWDYLKAEHFDALVEATLKTAAPDLNDEEVLEKPSNAIKLGYDLKRLINLKIGMAIMHNDKRSKEDAENLLRTMNIFWPTKVTKLARVLLDQRKYNKHEELPDPKDIEKLSNSLKSEISKLDLKNHTPANFRHVANIISARLVIYNRRRTGELQAIR